MTALTFKFVLTNCDNLSWVLLLVFLLHCFLPKLIFVDLTQKCFLQILIYTSHNDCCVYIEDQFIYTVVFVGEHY